MVRTHVVATLAILAAGFCLGQTAAGRTWKDSTGRFSVEAEFVEMTAAGTVVLLRTDGQKINVALDRLQADDQQYVRDRVRSSAPSAAAPGGSPFQETANPAEPDATQIVVAEGVGLTKEEADRDALRQAVRQVVGAVVDSDTLVKNDRLIEDKILIYSDGLVKDYAPLGEPTRRGQLIQVKIRAVVERRSIVARLRAENITVREVSGRGLFARAVTEMEAQQNATQLLKKSLAELPKLMTVRQLGEPDFDKSTSECIIELLAEPDVKAYEAFRVRFEELLKQIALRNDSAMWHAGRETQLRQLTVYEVEGDSSDKLVALPGNVQQPTVLLVNTFLDATGTRTRWNTYLVEAEFQQCIQPLSGTTSIHLVFRGENDQIVTEDEFPMPDGGTDYGEWNSYSGFLPYLRLLLPGQVAKGEMRFSLGRSYIKSCRQFEQSKGGVIYVFPFFMGLESDAYYRRTMPFQRRIKVSLEDLKRTTKIECAVKYRPLP